MLTAFLCLLAVPLLLGAFGLSLGTFSILPIVTRFILAVAVSCRVSCCEVTKVATPPEYGDHQLE